jgi:hypothetical protein
MHLRPCLFPLLAVVFATSAMAADDRRFISTDRFDLQYASEVPTSPESGGKPQQFERHHSVVQDHAE